MVASCVSAVNFDNTLTSLQYGRPMTQVVLDNTTASTADGSFSGSPAGTILIDQDVTWTNSTGQSWYVTPVFCRPTRSLVSIPPQDAWLQETWAQTTGNPAALPTLPASITQFGGGSLQNLGLYKQFYYSNAAATYAPLGQTLITAGQQLRVRYRCTLNSQGSTSTSGRNAYAKWHRLVFIADMLTDPAI